MTVTDLIIDSSGDLETPHSPPLLVPFLLLPLSFFTEHSFVTIASKVSTDSETLLQGRAKVSLEGVLVCTTTLAGTHTSM